MSPRQVRLRAAAAADIDDALAFLQSESGDAAAGAFIDAIEAGVQFIQRSPNAGSLRFAFELGIPELRSWPVKRFPYLIFYVALGDRIEVWRVLHTRRDIPASLVGDG